MFGEVCNVCMVDFLIVGDVLNRLRCKGRPKRNESFAKMFRECLERNEMREEGSVTDEDEEDDSVRRGRRVVMCSGCVVEGIWFPVFNMILCW